MIKSISGQIKAKAALDKHSAGVQDPVTAGRVQVRKITQERVRQLE